MFSRVDTFVRDIRELTLTHHVDVRRSSAAIHIHNYPDGWAEWFDEQALGAVDPVHRASNITNVGFAWSKLPGMIALTPEDRRVLELARSHGIGEGYTVPAHVPGEAHGSCSFACGAGDLFAERGSERKNPSSANAQAGFG